MDIRSGSGGGGRGSTAGPYVEGTKRSVEHPGPIMREHNPKKMIFRVVA